MLWFMLEKHRHPKIAMTVQYAHAHTHCMVLQHYEDYIFKTKPWAFIRCRDLLPFNHKSKGVGWDRGQGSVQATQLLPHQTVSLWTGLLCTGALSCWTRNSTLYGFAWSEDLRTRLDLLTMRVSTGCLATSRWLQDPRRLLRPAKKIIQHKNVSFLHFIFLHER